VYASRNILPLGAALIVLGKKTKVIGLIHNADKYGNTNKENLLKKQLKGKIVV
jgi:hypothetical protein